MLRPMQEKLKGLGAALAEAVPNTYHYYHPKMQPPYLVWAEDSAEGNCSDNVTVEQAITGVANYFTKTEYDPAVDAIQSALTDFGASWRLVTVDFEEETNLIHFSWDWTVA